MTDTSTHPARLLWNIHHPPAGYPSGVVGVPEPIPGSAFFPGGFGLWAASASGEPLPPFPFEGVMVIGQDFHSEAGYRASRQAGREPLSSPTWRNLIRLFDDSGILKEQCFFTNLYVGLRTSTSATGLFPGAGDEVFVAHCRQLLLKQIELQRPRLIICLGVQVPTVLGTMSKTLVAWSEGRGLRHLDAHGPVRSNVVFEGLPTFRTTIVALVHPSLRHASVRHRRYEFLVGAEAEAKMLLQGLSIAGLASEDLAESASERLIAKMTDQIQPGEADAWAKWNEILDRK